MTILVPLIPLELVIRRREATSRRVSLREAMWVVAVAALLLWAVTPLLRMEDRRREFQQSWNDQVKSERQATFFRDTLSATIKRTESDADDLTRQAGKASDLGESRRLLMLAAERTSSARDFRKALGPAVDRIAHHRRLIGKYLWAAHHPYLPVWPDPPSP